jgi:hypothetical protein
LRIQGDHGPIAFRNIRYALLNEFKAEVKDLSYEYYEGQFDQYEQATPDKLTRSGKTPAINFQLADNPNKAILVFKGKVVLPESTDYQWLVQGYGVTELKIDDQIVAPATWRADLQATRAKKFMTAGEHSFKLTYLKNYNWRPSALGLSLQKANGSHTSGRFESRRQSRIAALLLLLWRRRKKAHPQHGGRRPWRGSLRVRP